jgi:trk system potassium uptake protein TrkA
MYVIIGGAGFIGKGLAKRLVQQKHDVVVIDVDSGACEEVYAKYGAVTINGNTTDLETLESAGIQRCDIAVATTRKDADNLAFALLAKHYEVPQIIVRMINPKYEEIYKAVGVKNIARTTELLIDQIMVNIESPELRKVINLGNVEICIFEIPEDAKCLGHTVAEVVNQESFPRGIVITCVFEDSTNSFIIPRGDTKLNPRDRAFLCGSRRDIKKAIKLIKG